MHRGAPQRGAAQTRTLTAVAMAAVLFVVSTFTTSSLWAAPRQSDLDAARARLAQLEKEFELVVEEFNETHDELIRIQGEMATTQLIVRKIQKRMEGREDAAVSLAQELYKGGTSSTLEAVLSAESLTDIESRLQYLESSEDAHAKVFERLAVDRQELNDKLTALEEDRVKVMRAEDRLSELRFDIEGRVASQRDEIAELNAAIERAEQRAAARAAAAAEAAQSSAVPITLSNVPIKAAPAPNAQAQAAVDAALSQVGKPYQWGASGPNSYDCSGLTMWSWAHAGVSLPHSSSAQYGSTVRVAREDLAPGDLLFFGSPIHHVGLYIGNGQMVEAPYTGQYVRVTAAFRSDYVGAGRPGV